MHLFIGAPNHINSTKLTNALLQIPSVIAVNELHIWSLTPKQSLLSVHLWVSPNSIDGDSVISSDISSSADSSSCVSESSTDNTMPQPTQQTSTMTLSNYALVLKAAHRLLSTRFKIHHATIQINPSFWINSDYNPGTTKKIDGEFDDVELKGYGDYIFPHDTCEVSEAA